MDKEKTVPCSWCGTPTTYTGTKHCDPCHELDKRISGSPELAARITGYYAEQKGISDYKIHADLVAGGMKFKEEKKKGNKK